MLLSSVAETMILVGLFEDAVAASQGALAASEKASVSGSGPSSSTGGVIEPVVFGPSLPKSDIEQPARMIGRARAAANRLAARMKGRVLVDLRNIYPPDEVEEAGLAWHGVGRPARPRP